MAFFIGPEKAVVEAAVDNGGENGVHRRLAIHLGEVRIGEDEHTTCTHCFQIISNEKVTF